MSIDIYSFSGTGNSLAVARDVARGLEARLVSIPIAMEKEHVVVAADAVGLVFPVYHKSIPLILKRFVQRLEGLNQTYLFAVCTYGDAPGLAMERLDRLVQSRGGTLASRFGVHMPYNYLTPSLVLMGFFRSFTLREVSAEKQLSLIARASEMTRMIATSVDVRVSRSLETRADVLTRLADRLSLPEILAKPVWLRVAGVRGPIELSFLESRRLMDRAFWTDEACNGCRICSRICPVGDIKIVDDRPVWQERCEQCFACLQWCPQEAIQFGSNTAGRSRYHHPEVTVADMVGSAPGG